MLLKLIILVEIIILIILLLLGLMVYFNNKCFLIYIKKILCKVNWIDNKNEIIKNLWLGDNISAHDKIFIKDNNIRLIVNVTKECKFIDLKNIKKYRINICDDGSLSTNSKLLREFSFVKDLIKETLKKNQGVLIHCMEGVQRSAALTILYLMNENNISYDEAYEKVKNRRPCIFYNKSNFKHIFN
tara:strand:- start:257 stop:814 length:558 start_codon:yes stop_codon:yes gene_type:complete